MLRPSKFHPSLRSFEFDGEALFDSGVADNLSDLERDCLALGQARLRHARANDVLEGGLRTLDVGLEGI